MRELSRRMDMVELSNERIEQVLQEETPKKQELDTILRGIYIRYMCLYERYFADIDSLSDDRITEMKNYHEETNSLVKYYYMDIPLDICTEIVEFDKEYTDKLLGSGWHDYLSGIFNDFKKENKARNKSEEDYKLEFEKNTLSNFYYTMDIIFREGFGTESKTAEDAISGFAGLLFGKEK